MADTTTIEGFLAEWIAAFNAHDLDRHMALYAEDAILFGAVDELQVGRDAVRRYFGARGPDVRVEAYPLPLVRMPRPDIAITAGPVEFADGDQPMPYRVTWVLMRGEKGWQIVQHHGSPRRGL